MRSYPRNSPEAAARIVALILVSDGHVCRTEYETLHQLLAARDLGLDPQDMPGIVQTLCEDLLMEGFDGRSILTHVGDDLMASLMAEVDDARLQGQVLRIAASVAHADKHLSDGETAMLDAIIRHWQARPVTTDSPGSRLSPHALAPAGLV
jgi:tellurite resistance protein